MDFGLFTVMMFFGFMCTSGAVEYIFGTFFDKIVSLVPLKWTLMYMSLGLGIFLAFHYELDIPYLLLGLKASPVGVIATGIIMGRGANFINDVWDRFLPKHE